VPFPNSISIARPKAFMTRQQLMMIKVLNTIISTGILAVLIERNL
jgi:hypothetical protein